MLYSSRWSHVSRPSESVALSLRGDSVEDYTLLGLCPEMQRPMTFWSNQKPLNPQKGL